MLNLSLRLRIFLFFCALAAGMVVFSGVAAWLGYQQYGDPGASSAFLFTALFAGLLSLMLTAGVWLLFDENIAKPIERIAAEMRARAHAGINKEIDRDAAKYLGDLAPAAQAMTQQLSAATLDNAQTIAERTASLQAEKERLTAILSDIPIAVILVNPNHQIVLYDGQAADLLAFEGPARLNAYLFDYLQAAEIKTALKALKADDLPRITFTAHSRSSRDYDAVIRPMGRDGSYMLTLEPMEDMTEALSPGAERPLVYDFSLIEREKRCDIHDKALRDLCYVVFDTETTGLLPHKDEIVQIGAVRMVKGRIVPGEKFETLVNPGRAIPASSSKVHGITDDMVATAPVIDEAGKSFHHFARDAVLVAHNAPFDMAFLHRHKARIGKTFDHPVFDTVLLSAALFGGSSPHTLDALSDRLGIRIPAQLRHTAMGDAVATAQVFEKMIPMLEAKGFNTFGDVLGEMRKHQNLVEDMNA
ncbi:3'-5' exonuclease [Pseudaestuariivita rosea]|uniref:3'-5' exonuclease n=1 Tax=Pseudaestuariivita rosea TaxID=2763263 RepID=UPI001ABB3615|nr:exonuclease domain-containing protein [Pseudaestuariivita rosea]